MNLPHTLALLLLLLLAPTLPAQTATLGPHLTPTDPILTTVKTKMATQHWTAIRLFPTQSFPLFLDGKPVGILVSGDARPPGDSDKCFITLVEPVRPLVVHSITTMAQYTRGFNACQTLRAIGLLPSPSPAFLRIGVLYTISLRIENDPHGVLDGTDPYILSLDLKTHRITIDQPATDQAQAKFPENLPALAAALAP